MDPDRKIGEATEPKTLALATSSRLRSFQHLPNVVELQHVASFLEAMRLRHETRFRFLLRVRDARSRRREWRTATLCHADTLSGVSIENVSGLVAHSSVGRRQDAAEEAGRGRGERNGRDMSEPKPSVVILAGPNGAGKSTAAPELLQGELSVREFVNADVIARGLSAFDPDGAAIAAGRVMLARLDELAHQRESFAFETTLASPIVRAVGSRSSRLRIRCASLLPLAVVSGVGRPAAGS